MILAQFSNFSSIPSTLLDKVLRKKLSDSNNTKTIVNNPLLQKRLRAQPSDFEAEKHLIQKYFPFPLQFGETPAKKQLDKPILSKQQLVDLLSIPNTDSKTIGALLNYANSITESIYGDKVYCRGIVEFSNVCEKNCFYCGIRHDMEKTAKEKKDPSVAPKRYTILKEEIMERAMFAHEKGYGSFVLQSGEITSKQRIKFVGDLCKEIKNKTDGELGIVLSIGELPYDDYKYLYDCGAHRYLLRIETSNPELYKKLHPADHSWEERRNCLRNLKKIGYVVGSGVMIDLPWQTKADLAGDIHFFIEEQIDMIGMGPYILQDNTPLGAVWKEQHKNETAEEAANNSFIDTLKMIALTRICHPLCNMAATTALQAVNPIGREIGLNSGANIVMPIVTPLKYRAEYQLYQGKPCIDDDAEHCLVCLQNRIKFGCGKELYMKKAFWGEPRRREKDVETLRAEQDKKRKNVYEY